MIDQIAAFEGRIAKVDGPARSGKTEALVRRCARLLERREAPDSILVTVVSAAAKRRFAQRLADAVDESLRQAAARVNVMLPQEVCTAVLAEPQAMQLTGRTPRILDESEYLFFLEDLKTLGQKNQRLSNMLSFFYAQWSRLEDEESWVIPGEETIVLDRARNILRLQGAMLRHEAPYLCARLLASDEGEPLAQRYAYVLCDDFQDYSYAEQTALCLCAKKQVVVCGDAFQATEVYTPYPSAKGFRNFDRVRRGVEVFELTAQHGPEAALRLEAGLRAAQKRERGQAESGLAEDAEVAGARIEAHGAAALFVEWDDAEDEMAALPALVAAWCAQDPARTPADVAVAVPTKRWGKLAKRALEHAGLQTTVEGLGHIVSEDPRVPGRHDALSAYARVSLAADAHDMLAWRMQGGLDHALANSDIWRGVYDYALDRHIPLYDALETLAQPGQTAGKVLRQEELARIWEAGKREAAALSCLRGTALAQASGVADVPAFAGVVALLSDDADACQLRDAIRALLAGERTFDGPNAVTVALCENLCGLDFPCVVVPGLVDGMLPYRDAFEETKSNAQQAAVIARDRVRLASCVGKATQRLVASTFAHAEAEVAERVKMKVARIASRDGARIAQLRPSLYLEEAPAGCLRFQQGSKRTIEGFFARA